MPRARTSVLARRSRWLKLLAALAQSGVVAGCGPGEAALPPSAPSPALGQVVGLSLASNQGQLVSLPAPGARATVIDAFAPTCEPCSKTLPPLLAAKGALAEAGASLVLVAVLSDGESTEDAARALRAWNADAPFLVDRGDVLRRVLGIDTLPATVVLDAKGGVRWMAPSGATTSEVVAVARAVAGR